MKSKPSLMEWLIVITIISALATIIVSVLFPAPDRTRSRMLDMTKVNQAK